MTKGDAMRKSCFFSLLLLSSISVGDAVVVWHHDLTYLPDGWIADSHWDFSTSGAELSLYASEPYENVTGNLYSECILIPDNCDSILLHVEQYAAVGHWGAGAAYVRVRYRYNDMVWHTIWSTCEVTSRPIDVLVPPYSGQGLCIRFFGRAAGGSYNHSGGGVVSWELSDLTLTFYGNNMEFEQTTWASIKRCVD